MNASAVDPLHSDPLQEDGNGSPGNGYPRSRGCDKPACGLRGMQAGGLAAQSVNVLITRCTHDPLQEDGNGSPGNGSPVRSLLSRRHAGDPLLLLVQWVDRCAIAGHPLRFCCNGSNATNHHE